MFKKISSIFFDVIIIFAIFITYIVYKDTISLFEYSVSMIIITIIVMLVHEIGHLLTIKLFCYKVLYFRYLGIQFSFNPVVRVDFSLNWVLQSTVLGDYFCAVRKNDDLDKFIENFFIISISGPIANVFLIGVSVTLMTLLASFLMLRS